MKKSAARLSLGNAMVVAVAVRAKIFTSEGMRLLRVLIFKNAALKRSPHNFTQCASSTRRATKSSLYLINKTIVKQHQSLFL